MGLLNNDPALRLNATLARVAPPAGGIGFFSQSGSLGIAVIEHAVARGLGLSSFVSAGRRTDVSSNDLLAYWTEDARTTVVALYLESVGNPRRFSWLAPNLARRKPIVAVKSGRAASASRSATSHTTALAGLNVGVDALFEQAGVIRTTTLEELFDVAEMLSTQPLPAGAGVGVVTNAGGPGNLFTDACAAGGLNLPPLARATIEALRAALPPRARFGNPVHVTETAAPIHYERALALVGNDPAVDSVVALYVPPLLSPPGEIAASIARGAAAIPAHKPVLTVFLSEAKPSAELGAGPRGFLPCYHFPENAALALAAAARYRRWRDRPRGKPLVFDEPTRNRLRTLAEAVVARSEEWPVWLDEDELSALFGAAGIKVAGAARTTVDGAAAAAERLGYPLVAKVISPGLVHKSDVGGVILNLKSAAEVGEAAALLTQRMAEQGKALEGILLQREVEGGLEVLVGVTSDPTFGPLLVCGIGGVMAELNRDVAFRLHPVTDADAAEMLAGLRASRLLDGYRGLPPADRAALIDLIMRVSALIEVVPEITEIDLNPVKVLTPGQGAIVVDGRVRIQPPRRAASTPAS
jgi:acyl-CoA synthetase (NDP forming)